MRAGEVVGEGRVEEEGGVRGSEASRRSTVREATRQLSVFILICRAAAFVAMRPTLLFKLE